MSARSLKNLLERTLEELKGNAEIERAQADAEPHEWYVDKENIIEEIYFQLNSKNYLVKGEITPEMQEIVETGVNELYQKVLEKAISLDNSGQAYFAPQTESSFSVVVLVSQKQLKFYTDNRGAVRTYWKSSKSIFDSIKSIYRTPLKNIRTRLNNYFKKALDTQEEVILSKNIQAVRDSSGNVVTPGKQADTLLQLGHLEGESIADRRISKANQAINTGVKRRKQSGDINYIVDYLKNQGFTIIFDKSATESETIVKVFLQSASRNQGEQAIDEKRRVLEFRAKLETAIQKLSTEYLGSSSSDSRIDIEKKKILKKVKTKLSKNKKVKLLLEKTDLDLKASSAKKEYNKGKVKRKKVADSSTGFLLSKANRNKGRRPTRSVQQSYFSLIPLINNALPEVVRKNMGEPALVNRTGRFAQSARVTDITTTRKGYPSIGYTYQKNPYQIFEDGVGAPPWANGYRDPRKLIERSIRDIAEGLIQERFYTRRV